MHKEASSLASLLLKHGIDSWDAKDNRIVQVTRKMADTICYMTQYLKKKGPIPVMNTRGHFSALILMFACLSTSSFYSQNKEAFVTAARDVITSCQSVTQFISVIATHCLDKQCTVELSLIVEQILTITNQLNIISRSEDRN